MVISSSNIIDTHNDVHVKGLFDDDLALSNVRLLCKSHDTNSFNSVIDYSLAYTEDMTFKELGYDIDGDTEVLIFDSVIDKERNGEMHNQYRNGWVYNHSVGMYITEEILCEKGTFEWDKYYPMIANKEDVVDEWFYAITKAIVDHGSPVVRASNPYTPVIEGVKKTDDIAKEEDKGVMDTEYNNLFL